MKKEFSYRAALNYHFAVFEEKFFLDLKIKLERELEGGDLKYERSDKLEDGWNRRN